MGLNDECARRIVLDIETVALDDAGEYIPGPVQVDPPDLTTITAAKNLTDPAKIAASLAQRTAAAMTEYEEQHAKAQAHYQKALADAALDPDLCRIVAIGWARGVDAQVWTLSEELEIDGLQAFWSRVGQSSFLGFNILVFDLPVLIRRSQYLGVSYPALNLDRYRTPHVDLMQVLSFRGAQKFRSLDFYAKRFKIGIADPVSGKDIAGLVQAGNWEAVRAHCQADLAKTRLLAQRLGLL